MQQVSIEVSSESSLSVDETGVPRRRQHPKRRTTHFLIVLVSIVLMGNALVGERGLAALIRSSRQLAAISELIDTLRAENDGLREDVRSLREEPRAIEELARRELGLIEPGEKVFIVGNSRAPDAAAAGSR